MTMKSAFVLAFCASVVLAQTPGFMINTPSGPTQCEPTLLSWTGGTAPYFLTVLPGSQPSAPALEDLGQQNGTSFTWNTNIAGGTSVGLTLRDSTGAIAQSGAFTIENSSDTSCLSGGSSSGSSSGAAPTASSSPGSLSSGASSAASTSALSSPSSISSAATTSAPTLTTPPVTTTRPVTSPSSITSRPASSSSSPSSSPSTSSSNAAMPTQIVNLGAVGVFGAAVVALLA